MTDQQRQPSGLAVRIRRLDVFRFVAVVLALGSGRGVLVYYTSTYAAQRSWIPLPLQWFVLVCSIVIGVVLTFRAQELRRMRCSAQRIRCARCEYSLNGLESADRCPECGVELLPFDPR